MPTVLVSIVMPVYNVASYLAECIDSILAQTLQDWELIVVNDGSTDDSLSIIESYVARDKRVRVISKVNEGYGKAMNTGIDAAAGEYIGIVESDDIIDAQMYERLYQLAKQHDADMVKGGYQYFWDMEGQARRYEAGGRCPASLEEKLCTPATEPQCYRIPLYTWAGIYRRSWIEHWGIRHHETPGASYQDNGFWFQTLSLAKRAIWTNEVFYSYRQTNVNSSIHKKGDYDVPMREFDYIQRMLEEKSPERWEMVKPAFAPAWWAAMYYTYKRIDPKYHVLFLKELDSRMQPWIESGHLHTEKHLNYREAQFLLSMQNAQLLCEKTRVGVVGRKEWWLNIKQKLKKIFGRA